MENDLLVLWLDWTSADNTINVRYRWGYLLTQLLPWVTEWFTNEQC